MTKGTMFDELQEFFKALAEPKRLRIVGLLAQQPYNGEQLAALLELSESTVSHHLSYLVHAGLVTAEAQGYYNVYTLRMDKINTIARQLMSRDELPKLAAEVNMDAFDEKIVANFTTADGRIKSFPAQPKKMEIIVRYVAKRMAQDLDPNARYTEKQINEYLAKLNPDTSYLRRSLVDYGHLGRDSAGREYWIVAREDAVAG